MFYAGIALTGFCFGGLMGIYPGFTARQFGRKNNSMNYGIMFIGFALAGIFGPMIMTSIFAGSGRYQGAFVISAALAALALLLIHMFKRLEAKEARATN